MGNINDGKNLASFLEAALDVIQKNKLKLMLDGGNLAFFFLFGNEIYGAGEGSRVMFAKMKDPEDEDHSPGWLKEANFVATNLNKLGQGIQHQMIFSDKDLTKIEVISKEEAFSSLERFFEDEKESKQDSQERP